jgi:hypothetical protein
MDNVTIESLTKIHGDKAPEVYREIADKGGFGNEIASGGLDVRGVVDERNTAIPGKDKARIAELAGMEKADRERIDSGATTTAIAQNAGQLWGLLATPGAGARLTLDADGTPDATANATAFHYGATKAGAKLMAKGAFKKFSVDEFRAPIVTNVETVEAGISAELVGVTDMDVMKNLLPGIFTPANFVGYEITTRAAADTLMNYWKQI